MHPPDDATPLPTTSPPADGDGRQPDGAARAAHTEALAGVRVLEVGDGSAGYAGRLLRDLGADVVRVEPPGGAASRRVAPLTTGAGGEEVSLSDVFFNTGKRSVTLDLDRRDGQALLLRLAATADVVLETTPPGRLESLGVGARHLRERNPALIVVSVTPFGQIGPHAGYLGGDLVSLATGGLLHLGGYHDVGPVAVYGRQSDFIGSIVAAVATLAALLARRKGHVGGLEVDVSVQEGVTLALEDSLAGYELNGRVRPRLGGRAREAGTGTYPCADGYVAMVAGRLSTGRSWHSLVTWLGEEGTDGADALRDPAWDDFAYRGTPEAIETFGRVFTAFAATRTKAELYREGQRRSIAIAPVNTVDDVVRDPHLLAREAFEQVEQPLLGDRARFPRPPYRLSRTPPRIRGAAPRAGEHNAAVYRDELGLSESSYERLTELGVIG